MAGDCIFCRIAKKEIPSKIVHEDEGVIAFDDIRPQAPVHVVIIPKKHVEKVSDLAEGDGAFVGNLVLAAKKIARDRGLEGSGYRLVLNCGKNAGQDVFHIHLHLLGGRKFAWPPG